MQATGWRTAAVRRIFLDIEHAPSESATMLVIEVAPPFHTRFA
jgi:hypothetical protein